MAWQQLFRYSGHFLALLAQEQPKQELSWRTQICSECGWELRLSNFFVRSDIGTGGGAGAGGIYNFSNVKY